MTAATAGFANCAPGALGYDRDHPAAAHASIVDRDSAVLDLRGRRSFAVCGFAETTRHYIPLDDPAWVVMGLNQFYRHVPRLDVTFEMHAYWREGNLEGTDHPAFLASCGIPVVMTDLRDEVPTSVRFPVEQAIARFGVDYFTSTASYMLAWTLLHIDREVELRAFDQAPRDTLWGAYRDVVRLYGEYTVGLFGIDLVSGTEYERQKACVEFWVGRIASRGINVGVPPESALLKQGYRYGYQREPEGLVFARDVAARRAAVEQRLTESVARSERLAGALEELTYLRQLYETRARGGTIAPEHITLDLAPGGKV